MLKAVFTTMLLAMAAGQCIFTSTECQCSEQQSGNMCLKYSSGAVGAMVCEAYACGSGYACDCGGSEMCDIADCSSARDVYRASGAGPTAVGEIVACQQASQVQCVTTQGGGGGGGGLPVPRQLGEPCDAGAACIAGATCDCAGICQNEVSVDVIAVGDDSVALWVCGTKIGVTAGMGQRKTWSYTGPCPTLYYYATNNNWKTGITSAVQDLATNTIYPTQTDGSGLVGIVGVDVTDTTFFSDSSYDFSAWVPAVQSVDHQVRTPWMDMLAEFGSEAWSYKPTDQSGSDLVNTWYKVKIPMCA